MKEKLEKIFLENFLGAWLLGMVLLGFVVGIFIGTWFLVKWLGVVSLPIMIFLGLSACIGAGIQEGHEKSKKPEIHYPYPDWKKIKK